MTAWEEQSQREPLLCNWRPSGNAGLPPALADAVFGNFIDALTSTDMPSKANMDAAIELCRNVSRYYKLEVSVLPELPG